MPTTLTAPGALASPGLTSPGLTPGLTSPALTPGLATPALGTDPAAAALADPAIAKPALTNPTVPTPGGPAGMPGLAADATAANLALNPALTSPTGALPGGLTTPPVTGLDPALATTPISNAAGLPAPGELPISAPIGLDPAAGTYPTMAGAFVYDLYKSHAQMNSAIRSSSPRDLRCLRIRLDRGEDLPRLRAAPRLWAVRLVARGRRRAWIDRAGARKIGGLSEPAGLELPGLAEAPEIGRHDHLHRRWMIPSAASVRPSASAACDTTLSVLQQLDLIGRQQRLRQVLQERRLHPGQRERQRNEKPAALGHFEHVFHQLLEGPHLRPADLVDRAGLSRRRRPRARWLRPRRRRTPAGIWSRRRRSAAAPAASAPSRRTC